MKTSDKKSLEFILKHKDHFDQKLLEIIDHLSTTVDHLSLKNTHHSRLPISLLKSQITSLPSNVMILRLKTTL